MKKILFALSFSLLAFGKNIVFYHIPKTGGTSITSLLDSYFPKHMICPDDFYYQIELRSETDLKPYHFFRGHFFYSTNLKKLDAFRFTFLREPVSRILSEQKFFLAHYNFSGRIKNLAKEHAFSIGNPIDVISNNQVLWLSSYHRDDPCISMEQHLESAKLNLTKMDFVGIFEDFNNSVKGLVKVLGLQKPLNIPHLQTVTTECEVSKEEIEAIKSRNQYDILLYEYAKNLYLDKFKNL